MYTPSINLKNELSILGANNKYSVLIQRTSKKIRCSCYNAVYREPNPKCPKCVGTGWLFKFEKHDCFKQSILSGVDHLAFTEVGMLSDKHSIFYFEYNIPIEVMDYIWEVAFKNDRPVKLVTLFKVESVVNMRDESGNTQFKKVFAVKESLDKEFKNTYIGKAWKDLR